MLPIAVRFILWCMKLKRNHLLKYLYILYLFLPRSSDLAVALWCFLELHPCSLQAVIHHLPVDCISESNKIVAEKMRHMHRCCSLAVILSLESSLLNDKQKWWNHLGCVEFPAMTLWEVLMVKKWINFLRHVKHVNLLACSCKSPPSFNYFFFLFKIVVEY